MLPAELSNIFTVLMIILIVLVLFIIFDVFKKVNSLIILLSYSHSIT